jgi:hypothetical protein
MPIARGLIASLLIRDGGKIAEIEVFKGGFSTFFDRVAEATTVFRL